MKNMGMPRIGNTASPSHNRPDFMVDGTPVTRTVAGQLLINSSAAVVSLALAGCGIARINEVLGGQLDGQGRLQPVVARHGIPAEHQFHAGILAARQRAPKIRAMVDHLVVCFALSETAARQSPCFQYLQPDRPTWRAVS
jgi:DNA-binding transcriptional LysR family regulator